MSFVIGLLCVYYFIFAWAYILKIYSTRRSVLISLIPFGWVVLLVVAIWETLD